MKHDIEQNYPDHTPPQPPEGKKWEYRGMGWNSKNTCTFYFVDQQGNHVNKAEEETASGFEDLHYFEAVPINASSRLGTDPKGAAGKLKPQLQLIPTALVVATAAALADGAQRYGKFNWRENQVEAMTYIGAIFRHAFAYRDGEELTTDSFVPHLGAIAACCAILLDAAECGTLIDNRPKKPQITPPVSNTL